MTYGYREKAAMLIILPDAGHFQEYEAALDGNVFRDTLAGLQSTNTLTFSLPRFKFEGEVNLQEALSAMGMPAPFSDGADFTGISPSDLSIGYAAHKATISVDEQGTEASGATTLALELLLAPFIQAECEDQVSADHPFIFAIYHRDTGAVLFLGRVMNPAA
jgi:serpin B